MSSTALTVGNEKLTLKSIAFEDIKSGDKIAHMYHDLESHDSIAKLWVGVASDLSQLGFDWYGDSRAYSERDMGTGSPWVEFRNDSRDGIIIVSEWHEDEDGHSIWIVED